MASLVNEFCNDLIRNLRCAMSFIVLSTSLALSSVSSLQRLNNWLLYINSLSGIGEAKSSWQLS